MQWKISKEEPFILTKEKDKDQSEILDWDPRVDTWTLTETWNRTKYWNREVCRKWQWCQLFESSDKILSEKPMWRRNSTIDKGSALLSYT